MAWEGPTLPLASHLAPCLCINFSKPQFSHLEDGTSDNVSARIVLCATLCAHEGSHLRDPAEHGTGLHIFYQYFLNTSLVLFPPSPGVFPHSASGGKGVEDWGDC